MIDIDKRLRDYAGRWQSAQPPPPAPTLPSRSRMTGASHSAARWTIASIGVAAAVVAAVLVVHPNSGARHVSTAQSTASIPRATAPLLRHQPTSTPQIDLASGRSTVGTWTFFAQEAPRDPTHGVGSELCLGTATGTSNGSTCDDPTTMSSLTFWPMVVDGDPHTVLLAGVSSAAARRFSISLATRTVTTKALSTPALAGLEFFAVAIPAADYPVEALAQVIAVGADGEPLLETQPTKTPPLPPSSAPTGGGDAPASSVVWPLPGAPTLQNPTSLATDFAAHVLGLPAAQLVFGSGSGGPIDIIGIRLPATGKYLQVVAQQQPNNTWALILVGDQNQLRGVTYLPAGHPGAQMSLLPPGDSAQADITEVATDGVHHFHLGTPELATNTANLASSPIRAILITYRNNAGDVIGVLGGTF